MAACTSNLPAARIDSLQTVVHRGAGQHCHPADGYIHRAIRLRARGDVFAGEILERLLARIDQIVRGSATGLGRDDLLVQGSSDVRRVNSGCCSTTSLVMEVFKRACGWLVSPGGDLIELAGQIVARSGSPPAASGCPRGWWSGFARN